MPDFRAASEVIREAIARRVFPGAVVEVGSPTRPVWQAAFGSLTYDAGAAAVAGRHHLRPGVADQGHGDRHRRDARPSSRACWGSTTPSPRTCRNGPAPSSAGVTIRDLLSHCSGLPDHRPLFQEAEGEDAFVRTICALPLEYAPRSQRDLQRPRLHPAGLHPRAAAPSLEHRFAAFWAQAGAGEELQFRPPAKWRARIAPTEFDPWRGRLLVGEVHDDNCFAMGGVAGHAGLFGTASAVGAFARHVLQVLDGRAGAFSRASIVEFTTRRGGVPGSSRALAWDTMLPTSSCGTRMSARAIRPHRLHRHQPVAGSGGRLLRGAAHEPRPPVTRRRRHHAGAPRVPRCGDGGAGQRLTASADRATGRGPA